MINVANWEEKKARYEDYWNCRNKTPLMYIVGTKDNAINEPEKAVNLEESWFDPYWIIKAIRKDYANTYYGADAYPYISPTLGNDIMSAFLGLDIIYNESSAWVKHKDSLKEFQDFSLKEDNWHYLKMKEMLTVFAEDAKQGDYIVGMVDLNTVIDGTCSLIGSQNLCYALIDEPEEVKRVTREHFKLYKKVFTKYNDIVTKYQGGNTNWLGIYSDIPWYFISCDFMCMVSPQDFDEFVYEGIEAMAKFHPRTLFHLDGENAVIHLDKILEIKELTGVQVQATPARHTAEFWVPYIQKIQAAGKCVCIEAPTKKDLKVLMENCKPEGLFIKAYYATEKEAIEAEKMVEEYYKKINK